MPAWFVLVSLIALAPPVEQKDLDRLIGQLGARQFTQREKAQQQLWEAGEQAEPALRKAAENHPDVEVRRRSAEILQRFRWGIYPNTPKAVVRLIEQYQSGDHLQREDIVPQLLDAGTPGCEALLKIFAAEPNADLRRHLCSVLSRSAGRALPLMITEGRRATLDKLMEQTLEGDLLFAVPNYVAYCILTDRLDERIAHFRQRLKDTQTPEREGEVLFYLLRAKGDSDAALDLTRRLKRLELVAGLLEEQGSWKTLAAQRLIVKTSPAERLGFLAAYHRLAGETKEKDETLAQLIKLVEKDEEAGPEIYYAGKVLLLNGRLADGMRLMASTPDGVNTVFDILVAQSKFAEAFKFLDEQVKAFPALEDSLDVQRARLQYLLGEKDKAKTRFATLGRKIRPGEAVPWAENLVQWEWRLGLREDAIGHAAWALTVHTSPEEQRRLLRIVFPEQEEIALPWWTILRKKQLSEGPEVSMRSLRAVLRGQVRGKELASLGMLAETLGLEERTKELSKVYSGIAEVQLIVGDEESARAYLKKAATVVSDPAPLIRWGDWLVEKKRVAEAARAYQDAWEIDRGQPLALFLRGQILTQLGQVKEGAKLQEQAHWLPLGDDALRMAFLRELTQRNHPEAAQREREWILRTAPLASFERGEVVRQLGLRAYQKRDYLRAAELGEQALLRVYQTYINFSDGTAYVGYPFFLHRTKAQGFLTAGKVDDALREIERCHELLPGNPDLSITLGPALEKAGKTREAQALFERQRKRNEQLCREYPQSALVHNSLAWLCAACRRELELAQRHAEQAVALEPAIPGYRDTLAEVLFQRGQTERAIAEMKRCIEQDGRRDYFRRQLQRFEKGDRTAPIPSDDD